MTPNQDRQPGGAAFENILLRLTEANTEHTKAKDEVFLDRSIRFTRNELTARIGRSSKTVSKGLLPVEENAFFDSPVVSREHAKVEADLEEGSLHITDLGSLHGTALNGNGLDPSTPTLLKSGDVIRFGVHVARGLDVFYPVVCKVGIELKPVKASYQAPDPVDLSDDESECSCSSLLNHSDSDSDTSNEIFADADTTVRMGRPLLIESEEGFMTYNGDTHEAKEKVAVQNATPKDSTKEESEFGEKDYDYDNSDCEMEEDDDESDCFVMGDEENVENPVSESRPSDARAKNVEHDDDGDFLAEELNRYDEHPDQPLLEHTGALGDVPSVVDLSKTDEESAAVSGEIGQTDKDGENEEHHDEASDADTDTGANSNLGADNAGEMPPLAQTDVTGTPALTSASMINIPSLLNPSTPPSQPPQESAKFDPAITSTEYQPTPEPLMTSIAAEIAAWSSHTSIGEATHDPVGKTASNKRKLEDMLTLDDMLAEMTEHSQRAASAIALAEKETSTQDGAHAAKRQATASAVPASKKRRSVVWAVAEKVGVAALGGAVVLGSLIYTAPSF